MNFKGHNVRRHDNVILIVIVRILRFSISEISIRANGYSRGSNIRAELLSYVATKTRLSCERLTIRKAKVSKYTEHETSSRISRTIFITFVTSFV